MRVECWTKLDQKPFLTVFSTAEVNYYIKGKQELSKTKGNYKFFHKQIYLAIWLTYSHRFWKCLPHKRNLFFSHSISHHRKYSRHIYRNSHRPGFLKMQCCFAFLFANTVRHTKITSIEIATLPSLMSKC